jgi:hypothetical protein
MIKRVRRAVNARFAQGNHILAICPVFLPPCHDPSQALWQGGRDHEIHEIHESMEKFRPGATAMAFSARCLRCTVIRAAGCRLGLLTNLSHYPKATVARIILYPPSRISFSFAYFLFFFSFFFCVFRLFRVRAISPYLVPPRIEGVEKLKPETTFTMLNARRSTGAGQSYTRDLPSSLPRGDEHLTPDRVSAPQSATSKARSLAYALRIPSMRLPARFASPCPARLYCQPSHCTLTFARRGGETG